MSGICRGRAGKWGSSPTRIRLSPESFLRRAFQRKIVGQWYVTMLLKFVCVGSCYDSYEGRRRERGVRPKSGLGISGKTELSKELRCYGLRYYS